jgi:ribA/ribD-fused uncharacterized protein
MLSDSFVVPHDGAWTYDRVLAAEEAQYGLDFVFFWGHSSARLGEIGPHVLSQWYSHGFNCDGVGYPTAEHFMMAEKARLFGDHDCLAAILGAESPGEAKSLGRTVRGFDEAAWEASRFDIVTRVSAAKFGADAELRGFLVGTGTSVLVEASPLDVVWGIGMDENDPAAVYPSRWRGMSLLGFALMHVRAELR